jgi:hypothetical protein
MFGVRWAPRISTQQASGRLPSGKALAAVATTTQVLVASSLMALWHDTRASTGPQISGGPPAPIATEVSPVCTTTSPAFTLATPPGGVVNFAAAPSAVYVDTGTQFTTYSPPGVLQASLALPPLFTKSFATVPVIDPSVNIYLSSC